MKKIRFIFVSLLVLTTGLVGCDKEENSNNNNPLAGIKWKLVGFVDAENKVKGPEPDSDNSYWMYFYADKTWKGWTFTNELFGEYEIDLTSSNFQIVKLGGTKIMDAPDGNLFAESLRAVQSFSVVNDELRLHYHYNDKKNHLLFKSAAAHECGVVNISSDEYMVMEVTPEKVSITADNIHLIIKNHTKESMIYDAAFSLDYFDGKIWIPVNLDILFTDIGYILKSGESGEQVLYLFPDYCTMRGKYRIKKHITLTDNSTKASEYIMCAEFKVY
jgi:hypothetical protein